MEEGGSGSERGHTPHTALIWQSSQRPSKAGQSSPKLYRASSLANPSRRVASWKAVGRAPGMSAPRGGGQMLGGEWGSTAYGIGASVKVWGGVEVVNGFGDGNGF